MLTSFTALIARDLKRCLLRNGQTMMSLYVFMMLMVFFPLTLHPSQFDLAALSPALTWVSLFLASQLPLDRLFLDDYKNGSLTLWTFTPAPIEVIVLAKLIVAWLSMAFPLVITAVLTGTFFYQWPLAAFFTQCSCAYSRQYSHNVAERFSHLYHPGWHEWQGDALFYHDALSRPQHDFRCCCSTDNHNAGRSDTAYHFSAYLARYVYSACLGEFLCSSFCLTRPVSRRKK